MTKISQLPPGRTVSPSDQIALLQNGTTVRVPVSSFSDAGQPQPYVIGGYIPGTYIANQTLVQHLFEIPITFPVNFAGSGCFIPAGSTATADAALPILKNGNSIGTMNITAASQSVSFTVTSAQSFEAGDVLALDMSGAPDATLGNISPTLLGSR